MWLTFWVVLAVLSATPFGAITGFFGGIGIAMYGGLVGVIVQTAAGLLGHPLDWRQVGQLLGFATAGLSFISIVWLLLKARKHWLASQADTARLHLSRVMHIAGVIIVFALSFYSLSSNWRM